MGSHTYKLIELVGSSPESSDAAVRNAIARASETLNHLDWFEGLETRGHLVDGKIAHWQVTLKVGMRLETLESEKPAEECSARHLQKSEHGYRRRLLRLPSGWIRRPKEQKQKVPRGLSPTWRTTWFGKQDRFPRDLHRQGHAKWKNSTHRIRLSKWRAHELV